MAKSIAQNKEIESPNIQSRLYNAECTETMRAFADNSIDCIITDPPYNLGLFMHKRNTNLKKMRDNQFAYAGWDNLEFEEWQNNMRIWLQECNRVLKKRGTLVVFMAVIKVGEVIKLAEEAGFYYKTTGVWHKTNPMPRNMQIQFVNSTECWLYFINEGTSGTFHSDGKVLHDFVESSVCPLSEKKFGKHPTQKPLSIMKYLISTLTNPNDIVLDSFMGSGSTCVAAAELGRRYLGIEINSDYYNIAQARIENLSK